MTIYKKVFFLTILFSFSLLAQELYHKVQQKETLYSISKKYNTTIDEIIKLNPSIENQNLNIYQTILIKKSSTNKSLNSSKNASFSYFKINEKETLYNLTKKYNISEEKLILLNPHIKNGVKKGDSLKVPLIKKLPTITHLVKEKETIYGISKKYKLSVNELMELNPSLNNKELTLNQVLLVSKSKSILKNLSNIDNTKDIHIVLMLPFNPTEKNETIQKISNEFLIGSKLAIDSLAKEGKRIHLKVFDTKMDDEVTKTFIENYNFKSVDAIIGPMFKKEIELVLNTLKKTIPIFSPFSNAEVLLESSNLFITKPLESSFAEKMVEEVLKNYTNEPITIFTTEKEQKAAFLFKNTILEKHPESTINIVYDSTALNRDLLYNKNSSNIYVLASQESSVSNNFINFIYNDLYLNDNRNFKPYSFNYSPLFDEKVQLLKKLNFTYGIHQKINLNGLSEKIILQKIKDTTCLENSKHLNYGYDILFDVIDRMDEKGALHSIEITKNRLSSKFEYKKENKGFINKGIKLVKLQDLSNENNQ